jgi:hypothetical protein
MVTKADMIARDKSLLLLGLLVSALCNRFVLSFHCQYPFQLSHTSRLYPNHFFPTAAPWKLSPSLSTSLEDFQDSYSGTENPVPVVEDFDDDKLGYQNAGYKSGFVSIIGNANVGKSTLMNTILGQKLSAVNRKPQTTQHSIDGIITTENYQLVFTDTPGLMSPSFRLHNTMLSAVSHGLFYIFTFYILVSRVFIAGETCNEYSRYITTSYGCLR